MLDRRRKTEKCFLNSPLRCKNLKFHPDNYYELNEPTRREIRTKIVHKLLDQGITLSRDIVKAMGIKGFPMYIYRIIREEKRKRGMHVKGQMPQERKLEFATPEERKSYLDVVNLWKESKDGPRPMMERKYIEKMKTLIRKIAKRKVVCYNLNRRPPRKEFATWDSYLVWSIAKGIRTASVFKDNTKHYPRLYRLLNQHFRRRDIRTHFIVLSGIERERKYVRTLLRRYPNIFDTLQAEKKKLQLHKQADISSPSSAMDGTQSVHYPQFSSTSKLHSLRTQPLYEFRL